MPFVIKYIVFTFTLFAVPGFAFKFPTEVTPPYTQTDINQNFFHVYNQELKDLQKKYKHSIYLRKNLLKVSKVFQDRNQKALKEIKSDTPDYLPREKAQTIFNLSKNHPVVGFQAAEEGSRYDPNYDSVGFCFGRATYFHIELLRKKVNPKAIRKIFVIGQFLIENTAWNFHVVTAVKGPAQTWWVIDPALSNRVEPLEIWSKKLAQFEIEPNTPLRRYYVTDPVKFQPDLGAYDSKTLSLPIFHGFFNDLAKWLDTHP